MSNIATRFSSPHLVGNDLVWKLIGTRTEVRRRAISYRVLMPNGAWMPNAGGNAKTFRTVEAAMAAAIEHAGG